MVANQQARGLGTSGIRALETSPGLLETLVRRSWLIGLGTLAGLLVGYLYYTLIPPKFQSKAQLLVLKKRPEMVPGMERPGSLAEDYLGTQAGILMSPVVAQRAIRDGQLAELLTFRDAEDMSAALIRRLSVK